MSPIYWTVCGLISLRVLDHVRILGYIWPIFETYFTHSNIRSCQASNWPCSSVPRHQPILKEFSVLPQTCQGSDWPCSSVLHHWPCRILIWCFSCCWNVQLLTGLTGDHPNGTFVSTSHITQHVVQSAHPSHSTRRNGLQEKERGAKKERRGRERGRAVQQRKQESREMKIRYFSLLSLLCAQASLCQAADQRAAAIESAAKAFDITTYQLYAVCLWERALFCWRQCEGFSADVRKLGQEGVSDTWVCCYHILSVLWSFSLDSLVCAVYPGCCQSFWQYIRQRAIRVQATAVWAGAGLCWCASTPNTSRPSVQGSEEDFVNGKPQKQVPATNVCATFHWSPEMHWTDSSIQ